MKTRWFFVLLFIFLVGGVLFWRSRAKTSAKPAAGGRPSEITVVMATVTQQDIPIWLTGLGTAQAFNTVTVRPRVSGALNEVNFTEGQMVKAGDVLAQIDPRPYRAVLEQARAKKAQDEAQLANARLTRDRTRTLVASNAESQRILDEQEAAFDQGAALVQASQAALEAAQLDLDFTTVRAPMAGKTGVRLVDAGNLVTANQSTGIVVLAQLQPISAVFNLPQNQLSVLRRRMQADPSPLTVEAMADDQSVLATGELALLDNQIDTTTGTLRLKATFANEGQPLWPGQFISARLLVETRQQAVVVPTPVVQSGLDGPFAYVVKADNTVEARPIKPGPIFEGFTIIETGLKPGEKVVSDGQSKLEPGTKVKPQTPAAP